MLHSLLKNHSPIILDLNHEKQFLPRSFSSLRLGVEVNLVKELVTRKSWDAQFQCNPPFKFCKKIKVTTKSLSHWNKNVFGMCEKRITEIKNKLSLVQEVENAEAKEK